MNEAPRLADNTGSAEFNRREFLRNTSTALLGVAAAGALQSRAVAAEKLGAPRALVWGYLVHLSTNMWSDRVKYGAEALSYYPWAYDPHLRFDEGLWNDLVTKMAAVGVNLVVLDLGDGVAYESHPEIGVKGAWSVTKLKAELARLRSLGLEPIPKLNFSTSHDAWLGPYKRMVSTDKYYAVCDDLIAEVAALFNKPRFFHIGMDEEDAAHQGENDFVVVRQFNLWWHDFRFLCGCVQKGGSRPWMWSDYAWNHRAEYFGQMPKSVLQSNWYYHPDFRPTQGPAVVRAGGYADLENYGYDQIPCGSNYYVPENFALLVDHCRKLIAPERLFGFLQTSWRPTLEEFRQQHLAAIEEVGAAINHLRGTAGS